MDAKEIIKSVETLKEYCRSNRSCEKECLFFKKGVGCKLEFHPSRWKTDSLERELNITITAPYYELKHFLNAKENNNDLKEVVGKEVAFYEQIVNRIEKGE